MVQGIVWLPTYITQNLWSCCLHCPPVVHEAFHCSCYCKPPAQLQDYTSTTNRELTSKPYCTATESASVSYYMTCLKEEQPV